MPTTSSPIIRIPDRSIESPFRRPSGRSEHPASQGPIRPPADGPPGALSFGALRAIAVGLARVQQPVPPGDDDLGEARSVRLLATAFYDVWLITWPDGSGLGPHDHGGVRSVMHVVEGELLEIFADHVDEQAPQARVLRRGESVHATPSFVHDLANRSGVDATTIHVYSPPLADVSFFDLRSAGEHERLRTTAVAGRVPQASSSDLPPSRLPPLSLVQP